MANLTMLSLDDPIDGSLSVINGNFSALNAELGSHTHPASSITSGVFSAERVGAGVPTTGTFLRGDSVWAPVTWSDVAGKPTTFPPSAHNHSASEITSGVLAPARLGSGTASASRFLRGDQQWAPISLDNLAETGGYFYRSGRTLVWENPPDTYTSWQSAELLLRGYSGADVPAGGGAIRSHATRGTPTSPLPMQSGDTLFALMFEGRRPDGQYAQGGRIVAWTPANWSNTSTPATLHIGLNAPGETGVASAKFVFEGAGRLGIGTTAPAHPLHVNVTSDWQGFRLDRGGSARALIAQDSAGGVIELFDNGENMRLQLHAGWYSKIPIRLGINLPDGVLPDWQLHVYDQANSNTAVWVENNFGAQGALAQVRCLSWSGTGTPVGGYFVGHGSRGTKSSPIAVQTGDRLLALIGMGQQATTQGTGAMVSIEAASNWTDSNGHSLIRFLVNGPGQAAFPPAERMRIEGEGAMVLQPAMQTPSSPAASSEAKIYIRNNKLVIQYNDAGTIRYKWLDLDGTGVTWQHSTTAP